MSKRLVIGMIAAMAVAGSYAEAVNWSEIPKTLGFVSLGSNNKWYMDRNWANLFITVGSVVTVSAIPYFVHKVRKYGVGPVYTTFLKCFTNPVEVWKDKEVGGPAFVIMAYTPAAGVLFASTGGVMKLVTYLRGLSKSDD